MKFTFYERKIKLTDDIKTYAERKIEKLDRFFKHESDAHITFGLERGRYRVEVTLHNNGMYYRVSEVTSDMFASIDSAVAAIERQIRKHKTRLEKKLRAVPWSGRLALCPVTPPMTRTRKRNLSSTRRSAFPSSP